MNKQRNVRTRRVRTNKLLCTRCKLHLIVRIRCNRIKANSIIALLISSVNGLSLTNRLIRSAIIYVESIHNGFFTVDYQSEKTP